MAAYAALVSLLNIMDQIHDHPRLSIILQQNQIELLQQSLNRLLEFVKSGHVHRFHEEEAQSLESQITSAAYAAEDVIEAHVVEQIPDFRSDHLLDLDEIIQAMDHVNKNVATFEEKIKDQEPMYQLPIASASTSSSSRTPLMINTEKNTMIGFDDELYQLKDVLTGNKSSRQIISIVGMGGIGKTTLAKHVYDQYSLKLSKFDVCAWATLSHECNIDYILSTLLCHEPTLEDVDDHGKLALKLHKKLIGRRYLIVLDDMWSIDDWDKIKHYFPENNNKSRVVITTRQSNVGERFDTCIQLKCLDENKSWELLREIAFPEGRRPSDDLEVLGRKIVNTYCGGLPLSIVVIGAILRNSSTSEYWENIADDINSIIPHSNDEKTKTILELLAGLSYRYLPSYLKSFLLYMGMLKEKKDVNSNDEETKEILDILGLSYRYLPSHLKPCFLYMGMLPKGNKIHKSRLIKLWVAEGFVKSNETQSLEEVAGGYLKDLVDRNLVGLSTNLYGKRETYQMHHLLMDLCLQLAEKENFLRVIRAYMSPHVDNQGRHIVFQHGTSSDQTASEFNALESASPLTRSLSHDGDSQLIQFNLLRVLNVPHNSSYKIDDILKQVNLRYICKGPQKSEDRILSSISLPWNLQTIIIKTHSGQCDAPPEIWEMRQLRHVNIHKINLPDPPPSSSQSDEEVVLRNLQSLKRVWNLRLSKEVCKRIRKVKKLGIVYNGSSRNRLYDFSSLHNLESLKCGFKRMPHSLRNGITFPSSLQKLVIGWCRLPWEDLTVIGSLPKLEVLKMERNSFYGPEWNPVEGEFINLKLLVIDDCDLIYWNADDSHFPALKKLVLCQLKCLEKIPSSIGDITTLGFISLDRCSVSAAVSAMEILKEQLENFGDSNSLQLQICYRKQQMIKKFKIKTKDMKKCFKTTNFQLIRKF